MADRSERLRRQQHRVLMQPNNMRYIDGSGAAHEIHIPTGRFNEAAALYGNSDWEELNTFPAWAGQDYIEVGLTYFTCDEYSDETGTEDEDDDGFEDEDEVGEKDTGKPVNDDTVILIEDDDEVGVKDAGKPMTGDNVILIEDEDEDEVRSETVAEDDGRAGSKRNEQEAMDVCVGEVPREYIYISD